MMAVKQPMYIVSCGHFLCLGPQHLVKHFLDMPAWVFKGGICTYAISTKISSPGPIVQSVASLITDSVIMSLILARYHTFVEIDHEIFSTVILLLPLI